MTYSNNIPTLPALLNTDATSSLKPVTRSTTSEAGLNAASASAAEPQDQASLSPDSTLVAKAMEGSDVRSEKVSALQAAIASGTYNVSSSDVADKLMQSMLQS